MPGWVHTFGNNYAYDCIKFVAYLNLETHKLLKYDSKLEEVEVYRYALKVRPNDRIEEKIIGYFTIGPLVQDGEVALEVMETPKNKLSNVIVIRADGRSKPYAYLDGSIDDELWKINVDDRRPSDEITKRAIEILRAMLYLK